jgi:hypothetical protein
MTTFSFDFNHGGARPADDPRSRDVSERVNDFIDAAFFAKRAAEPVREYVGASAIGNECLRALQFSFAGAPTDEGRITGKTLRIWEIGHVFEAAVGEWIKAAGFELEIVDPATGKQYGFSVLDGKGSGHLDGILRAGPVPLQYPCLWECKALNEKSWQDTKKRGLALSKPIYAAQVAMYQAYLGLTAPALFTALNKNTEELHHELVPFDQPLAQQMSDRMTMVVQSTEAQQLLPRAYSSPDNFKCKWCDFAKTCWSLKR